MMDFPPPAAFADTLQPLAAAPHFLAALLAQGSSVTSSSLSLGGIPSWKCSPSRFSAPGIAFQGHVLLFLGAVLCQTRCWGHLGLVTSQGGTSRAWQGLLSHSVTSRCPFPKDSGIISAQWCCQALPQTFRAVTEHQ